MSADELKNKGNEAFSAKDFNKAIEYFTEAIELDSSNHVLFSNRSASFASLGRFQQALADAEKTISLKSDWAKGYSRKGAALQGLGDVYAAREAYEEGLKYDAGNAQLKEGIAACEKAIAEELQGGQNQFLKIAALFTAPDTLQKLASNPKTASLASDPSFLSTLAAIRANPLAVQQHFNEKLLLALSVLMNPGDATAHMEDEDEAEREEERERARESERREKERKEAEKREAERKAGEEASAAVDPVKAQAQAEKDKGTAAYKAKDFPTAITHYTAAAALDPTDMVFPLNLAAVYYEMGNHDMCIQAATQAVEIGQEQRADYKLVAKALARIAKSHAARKDYDNAIKFYDKSLTNHRNQDTLNAKKEIEKEYKEAQRLAYIDPAKSAEAKERGNKAFSSGDFPAAVKEYTEAILRNPSDGKLYSNRAAAYTKLLEFNLALKDCDECVRVEPGFIKGYLRKGAVLVGMKKHAEALKAYQHALEIDPNHPEALEGVRAARVAMREDGLTPEQRAQQAMSDPEIVAIMQDPVMQAILQQMQSEPKAFQEHMKNKDIAVKIQKLINSGVIGVR